MVFGNPNICDSVILQKTRFWHTIYNSPPVGLTATATSLGLLGPNWAPPLLRRNWIMKAALAGVMCP